MSGYCNKGIINKVVSVKAILVTYVDLKNVFTCWENHNPEKSNQNLKNLQGNYLEWSFIIVKPFFVVHSNFTYDSEAYDFMKLLF